MSTNPAAASPAAAVVVADQDDEQFDVVDERNQPIGIASRNECHQKGLLHRSTHILLFRKTESQSEFSQVLLQRRSRHKKVGAGLWDVSVAEHLSSGEDYATATIRGLAEELSLTFTKAELVPVRGPYLSRQWYMEAGVTDHMFTTLFAAQYDEKVHGKPTVDMKEVCEIEWWPVERVLREFNRGTQTFTRWFLIELENISLKDLSKRVCAQ